MLSPSNGLAVEVLRDSLRPGRAKIMHSASTHQISSRGGAALQFTLGDEDETEFRHEFQVTDGGATPAIIIGVDFWVAHAARFNFASRVIELEVNGKSVKGKASADRGSCRAGRAAHERRAVGEQSERQLREVFCAMPRV